MTMRDIARPAARTQNGTFGACLQRPAGMADGPSESAIDAFLTGKATWPSVNHAVDGGGRLPREAAELPLPDGLAVAVERYCLAHVR